MAVNVWTTVIFALQVLFLCFLYTSGTSYHDPYQILGSEEIAPSSVSRFSVSFASHGNRRYRRQSNTSGSPEPTGSVIADTATNSGNGGQTLPDQSSQPVGGSSTFSVSSTNTTSTTVLPTTVTTPAMQSTEGLKEDNTTPEDVPLEDADIIHMGIIFPQDYHDYYTSSIIPNKSSEYWVELENMPRHETLSTGHRVAAVFNLKFDFYFYGHKVTNVTVATGGFMYMSPFLHQWLTATQYIAPLMANFDPSLSTDSNIYLQSEKKRFIAEWKNVMLKDQNTSGKFHFQAILNENGSIQFVYKSVPLQVLKISNEDHPVKVGLSDAYYNDTYIKGENIKRRVIYEYHKVALRMSSVNSGVVILLNPLPTCNRLTDCESCTKHEGVKFNCRWCNTIGRCSDGLDWYRQHWDKQGCANAKVSTCMVPATYSSAPSHPPTNIPDSSHLSTTPGKHPVTLIIVPTQLAHTSSVSPQAGHTSSSSEAHSTVLDAKSAVAYSTDCGDGKCNKKSELPVAVIVIVVLIIFGLLAAIIGWVYYAYTHPTSKSGMWLIAHRPSQFKSKIKFWKNSSDGSTKYKVESEA